jgi:16S rRNA C967 or C1407 C5-methylase (RsmB/RsmF family)
LRVLNPIAMKRKGSFRSLRPIRPRKKLKFLKLKGTDQTQKDGSTTTTTTTTTSTNERETTNSLSESEEQDRRPKRVLSDAFKKYYQTIVSQDEWDLFVAALQKKLPVTWRINGTQQYARIFREKMELNVLSKLKNIDINGYKPQPPFPIAWYPNHLAWRYDINPKLLQHLPEFHAFLTCADAHGDITRQEEVSMIPALFLDIKHFHWVLDMCAAPGSKLSQIIHLMKYDVSGQQLTASSQSADSQHVNDNLNTIPSGLLIANEPHPKRCLLLTKYHEPFVCVTRHEAQNFPNELNSSDSSFKFEFDRILCDVPCSGDGTLRKLSTRSWSEWTPERALRMHRKQIEICTKGISLLKNGGRLVYSTCSLNPIENEAVVAAVLKLFGPDITLVDCSNMFPNLRREKGLTSWKVYYEDQFFSSFKEFKKSTLFQRQLHFEVSRGASSEFRIDSTEHGEPEKESGEFNMRESIRITRSMFPPSISQHQISQLLPRCMRFYPHFHDSGGFFVAVFEKKEAAATLNNDNHTNTHKAAKFQQSKNVANEKSTVSKQSLKYHPFPRSFASLNSSNEPLLTLKKVYGLQDTFPWHLLRVPSESLHKNKITTVYLFSESLAKVIDIHSSLQNPGDVRQNTKSLQKLNILNGGLIVFERTPNVDLKLFHNFALTLDSVPVIWPYLGPKRCFELPHEDILKLLDNRRLFYREISNSTQRHAIEKLFVGYVVLLCSVRIRTTATSSKRRNKLPKGQTEKIPILCRNGQGSLTLCGNKFDIWALKHLIKQ